MELISIHTGNYKCKQYELCLVQHSVTFCKKEQQENQYFLQKCFKLTDVFIQFSTR